MPGRQEILVASGVTDYVGVQPGAEAIVEFIYSGAGEPIVARFDGLRLIGTFDIAGPDQGRFEPFWRLNARGQDVLTVRREPQGLSATSLPLVVNASLFRDFLSSIASEFARRGGASARLPARDQLIVRAGSIAGVPAAEATVEQLLQQHGLERGCDGQGPRSFCLRLPERNNFQSALQEQSKIGSGGGFFVGLLLILVTVWISEALEKRFPDNTVAPAHFGELLAAYEASGPAPPHMRQEVITGERGLRAHIWEAMLYRYLCELGFEFRRDMVRKAGQQGPDFGLLHGGTTIWVEAIVPAPDGIPAEYLRTPKVGEVVLKTVPHQEKLLRWTAALKEKREKFQRYVRNGTIPVTDPTVIAINGSRLADWSADDNGVSRMPLAVEATFPVGPIAVPISRDGRIDGEATRIPRYSIENANGAEVRTDSFLNPLYANVSAVIGAVKWDMLKPLPLTVVHNPLAAVPLPTGIFAATKEYVADNCGDDYLLRPLTEPPQDG